MYVGMIKTALEIPGLARAREFGNVLLGRNTLPRPAAYEDVVRAPFAGKLYGDELAEAYLDRNPEIRALYDSALDAHNAARKPYFDAKHDALERRDAYARAAEYFGWKRPAGPVEYDFKDSAKELGRVAAPYHRTRRVLSDIRNAVDDAVNEEIAETNRVGRERAAAELAAWNAEGARRTRNARLATAAALGIPAAAGAAYYALKD